MKQEVKKDRAVIKKWVSALRSGKYKQTDGMLVSGSRKAGFSYCCLGVLCRVAKAPCSDETFRLGGEEVDGNIPLQSALYQRAGLTPALHDELVKMNDNYYKSFNQIADFIEKKLLAKPKNSPRKKASTKKTTVKKSAPKKKALVKESAGKVKAPAKPRKR